MTAMIGHKTEAAFKIRRCTVKCRHVKGVSLLSGMKGRAYLPRSTTPCTHPLQYLASHPSEASSHNHGQAISTLPSRSPIPRLQRRSHLSQRAKATAVPFLRWCSLRATTRRPLSLPEAKGAAAVLSLWNESQSGGFQERMWMVSAAGGEQCSAGYECALGGGLFAE